MPRLEAQDLIASLRQAFGCSVLDMRLQTRSNAETKAMGHACRGLTRLKTVATLLSLMKLFYYQSEALVSISDLTIYYLGVAVAFDAYDSFDH